MTPGASNISVCSHIGGRPTQEDRYLVVPDLAPDITLLCVMDGTVGDFVAQRTMDLIVPSLRQSKSWNTWMLNQLDDSQIRNSLKEAFAICDDTILTECNENNINYSACTLVLCIVIKNRIIVTAHVGDSRAALVLREDEYTWGEFLTSDHRPDSTLERNRIESVGGSVVYLASRGFSTSFIRGGDFKVRREAGDQPMQLQYSRAIGGKDLKPFGLSSEPDIRTTNITSSHFALILGTDGLWDKITSSQSAKIITSLSNSEHFANELVKCSISDNSDNVTAIVFILNR